MNGAIKDKELTLSCASMLLFGAVLQFVYSLSHAIALRKVLLLVLLVMVLKFFWQAVKNNAYPVRFILVIFSLLQIWMLVVSGYIANQPLASFAEWKGQWLPPFVSFIVGIGIAYAVSQSKLREPKAAVLLSILIPIAAYLCINDAVIIHEWVRAGAFIPNLGGIGDHHGISGYLVGLLLPIVLVDLLSRSVGRGPLVPSPTWAVWALLALLIGTLIATTNRNGLVAALLAVALGVTTVFPELNKTYSRKTIVFSGIAVLTASLMVAVVAYKMDSRWHQFFETIPIAWDIDRDQRWLNADDATTAPLTANGRQVDISEYSRIAWAHEGWRMLITHLWGTEISRSAFHNLEVEKYGHADMAHSHNSWIDFGLEVGIPGLLLWSGVLFLLIQLGWRAWRSDKDPMGLALVIVVAMYSIRGLLDSIFRDHELEQFILVAGLLFGSVVYGRQRDTK